ncbi:PLP-dependent lyase/thiolase [Sphaerisporangium krabiense]|uniref:Diaminopropionate ammonia-lyase n=1 Tax=Sphaerisporangium krabiense TaxID=763782 RepID=A0A7W8Z2C4_9ACTN|nr:diaminopropionate ammonia-lyase [Sphaerisporangium krabiense]MBB5626087.1 diaminopropionate ammonia-lyase [Sphaerisporangium krabiense]GII64891.1 PLP-dependent lyase/thiolase [Sphaerisporangium krabiense]
MRYRLSVNRAARPRVDLGAFNPPDRAPLEFHRRLPGYARTPLTAAPSLAERAGVAEVMVKDESSRLGLPSFKILGASWAVAHAVREEWGADLTACRSVEEMRDRLRPLGGRTLAAATDGNHGRGVARMAALFGWRAHIFVPLGTVPARMEAIRSEGAEVTVVEGTYDEAIERSAAEAGERTLVISDTSWPGYESVPRAVIEGYSTLFHEVADQLAATGSGQPDAVIVQAGVGALAAAAVRHFRAGSLAVPPRVIIVEPETAACLFASAEAGALAEVPGPHPSIMAGLNCGRPSPLAWPLVVQGADVFLSVEDEAAREAMRVLAKESVVAGETGAAGAAGLLAAGPEALGLTPESRVLILNTEGATDPDAYRGIVGAAS